MNVLSQIDILVRFGSVRSGHFPWIFVLCLNVLSSSCAMFVSTTCQQSPVKVLCVRKGRAIPLTNKRVMPLRPVNFEV